MPYPNAELFSNPLPSAHSSRIYVKKNTKCTSLVRICSPANESSRNSKRQLQSTDFVFSYQSELGYNVMKATEYFCVVINERCCNHGVHGFHKRMVGFESFNEENPVREKEQNNVLLEKYRNFTWSIDHLWVG